MNSLKLSAQSPPCNKKALPKAASPIFSSRLLASRRAQSFDKLNLLPPLPPPQKKKFATITITPTPDAVEDQSSKPSKSFWGFKRSTSLNNYDLKKTLIFSLPSLLSRSKSTRSVPVP
ncbi:hypothetical protein LINPERPRIM_LOCUS35081 [Linum perenne]